MSVFAGVVRFEDGATDRNFEQQLSAAVRETAGERTEICRVRGALFARNVRAAASFPGAHRRVAVVDDGRILFSAFARLDNRDELGTALGLTGSELANTADPILLMNMLERWGDAGVARCLGAFAFARWEPGERRLTLGRDCLGNHTLLFHYTGRALVFSNMLATLLAVPDVPRRIDDVALANFLVLNHRNPTRTLYRGIERVPNRTMITIDRAGIRPRFYWAPNVDVPPPYHRDQDYVERARELFDQAVAAVTAGVADVAIATSGGLDSSAVAATVARLGTLKRISCYTLLPPADLDVDVGPGQYASEQDKVEALARMYPALDLRLLAPEALHPVEEDDTRHFARANLPTLGPTALGWTAFLNDAVIAARHPLLLVGTRGNSSLSWTGKCSLLALLRGRQWAAFAHEFAAVARSNKRGLAQTFASDILWPAAPAALRRLGHRLRGRDPLGITRYSALNPDFIAEHDLGRQWRDEGFDGWYMFNGWEPARHRARRLFDRHHAHRDEQYWLDDVEMRDPFADRRLIEFALSVPEPLYRRNGVPRSFARAVFADRLPREILSEQRDGAGGGAWFRRLTARRPAIAAELERLENSATARRLIDLPRLKRLLDEWPVDEHAAELRDQEYKLALTRGVHVGRFIRWVEGGNT
jgi:asparagine synthase (glutamine-hydrolysing)